MSSGPSADPARRGLPERVGPYAITGILGQGGMGTVLAGVAPNGSPVALKLIRSDSPRLSERFEREARLLHELSGDPGFVPLLDLGRSPLGTYLVMPLVPGGTLGARLRAGPLEPAAALALVEAVGAALGRAHQRGLIHRDLKPENVLFDAEGRPLVADLGLGKHLSDSSSGQSAVLSKTGEVRGTLGYMAPEQYINAKHVDARADVFALGALLYECLAGIPAFAGSPVEVMATVMQGGAPALVDLDPRIPRAISDYVGQTLAPDPALRPADGAAFVAGLQAARAAPAPSSPRSGRRARALGLFVLGGLTALGLVLAARARAPGEEDSSVQPKASQSPTPEGQLGRLPPALASLASARLQPLLALGTANGRHAGRGDHWTTTRTSGVVVLPGGRVATGARGRSPLRVWSERDGSLLATLAEPGCVAEHLCALPGSPGLLLTSNIQGSLSIWDPAPAPGTTRGRHVRTISDVTATQRQYPIEVEPAGRLAFGWEPGTLRGLVWDLEAGALLRTIPNQAPLAYRAPDLAYCYDPRERAFAKVDPRTGELLGRVPFSAQLAPPDQRLPFILPFQLMAPAEGPGPNRLVVGSGRSLEVYDLDAEQVSHQALAFELSALATSPAWPEHVLLAGVAGELELRDLRPGGAPRALPPLEGPVDRIVLSAERVYAAIGAAIFARPLSERDSTAWPPIAHTGSVRGLSWTAAGLVSGGSAGDLVSWDLTRALPEWRRPAPPRSLLAAMNPKGRVVVLHDTGRDHLVRIDLAREDSANSISYIDHREEAFALSPDGTLLTFDGNSILQVATPGTETLKAVGADGSATASHVAISDEGDRALVPFVADGRGIYLWSLADKRPLTTLTHPAHEDHLLRLCALTFVPGQAAALSGDTQGRLLLWSLSTGIPLRVMSGRAGRVEGLAPHPGGRYCAVLEEVGSLRLWDLEEGRDLGALEFGPVDDHARALAWSPTGDQLAVGTDRGRVLVFAFRAP